MVNRLTSILACMLFSVPNSDKNSFWARILKLALGGSAETSRIIISKTRLLNSSLAAPECMAYVTTWASRGSTHLPWYRLAIWVYVSSNMTSNSSDRVGLTGGIGGESTYMCVQVWKEVVSTYMYACVKCVHSKYKSIHVYLHLFWTPLYIGGSLRGTAPYHVPLWSSSVPLICTPHSYLRRRRLDTHTWTITTMRNLYNWDIE